MATYHESGVDLAAADRLVDSIGLTVRQTWSGEVVGEFGGFAAGVRVPDGYRRPVLMMSTDGVGTKIELARAAGQLEGLGFDLVAMCVDDLAAVGARPIAFTDYLAVGELRPEREKRLIESIAAACAAAGCALLGGETAEHPGTMPADAFDLAGAALGVVEDGWQITGSDVQEDDVIIGVASPNLRSNGFSLVRAVLGDTDLGATFPSDERTVAEVLLDPSVIYAPAVAEAVATGWARGLAHITGGALPGNLPRMLPPALGAVVHLGSWPVPPVFEFIRALGGIADEEMFRTFNMGVGFAVVAPPGGVAALQACFAARGHDNWVIGRVAGGEPRVRFA